MPAARLAKVDPQAAPEDGTTVRPASIRSGKSRIAILASARQLFIQKGYEINLEEVAAHAGVTKRTLYNHFTNKRTLLSAVLDGEHATYRQPPPAFEDGGLRGVLAHYAYMHRTHVLNDENMKFYRLLATDVSRFPDMAMAFYKAGLGWTVANLGHRLQAGIDKGYVRQGNPERMAERFFAALSGLSQRRALAGFELDDPAIQQAYLDETVDAFVEVMTPR